MFLVCDGIEKKIVNKVSMFKNWCRKNNVCNRRNLSHVLMDGGVLSIPFDKLNEFYEVYVSAVKSGEKLFVVEQKTDLYNFFVDIDFKGEDALSLDEIKDICKVICTKVKRYCGKECLICVAPPKKIENKVKTGIHLNWPGFVVNQKSAIALREHILVALYTAKGSIDWNEIIDSAVYGDITRGSKGSGFRMPFSHKKGKHDPCGGQGCAECKQTGKAIQVAYLPVFVHGGFTGLMSIDQTPTVDIMKMATVRTDSTEHIDVEPPSKAIKEGNFSKTEMKDEVHDEFLMGEIEEFVQNNLEGQGDARITKIFKHNNQFLVSTTSHYCENLGRRHGSNHIWFYISGDMIAQKCFCRCETIRERKCGFCKDFIGKRYLLTAKLKDMLYPEKVKCPEIKPPPKVEPMNPEIKPELELFIRKYYPGNNCTKLIKVVRNKTSYTVFTNATYCHNIKSNHEKCITFKIVQNFITQECSCKNNIKIKLTPKIFNLLKKK